MFRSRTFIIILCVILACLLAALLIYESKDPEAGSELIRNLLRR